MVRPESLRLYAKGSTLSGSNYSGRSEGSSVQSHRSNGQPFLEGRIDKVVYLGSVCEYEIDAGLEKPVLAVTHNPIEEGFFQPGELVGMDFNSVAAHALPLSQ